MIEQVKEYIIDELLLDDDIEVSENTSLFEGKVLDSLNLVDLINFLENKFEVKINPSEVTTQNLDTLANIQNFISSKKLS